MTDPPITPERIAMIRRCAADRDPFYRGAAWLLDQLEASANGGGFSHSKETP